MALYAIDALDDSLDATREFLLDPFSIKRWLVLAVVVFFIGGSGAGSFGSNSANAGGEATIPAEDVSTDAIVDAIMANLGVIILVGTILLAVFLAFAFIASVMEFVFVQSLRTDEVRVFAYAGEHLGKAVGLFAFRLVLYLLALGVFGGLAYVGYGLVVDSATIPVGPIVALVLVGIVVGIVIALVDGFTTAFVVPVMLVRDCGVRAGWRQFAATLRESWLQYLAYVVAAFILRIGIGIVVSIVLVVAAIVVVIPYGIVGVLAYVGLGTGTAGLVVLGLLVVAFALTMFVVSALVQVPVVSYLRYYALFVLGDTDATLDPIPDLRAAVRDDQPTDVHP